MKRYLKHYELTETDVNKSVFRCLCRKRWKRRDTSYMLADYYRKMNNSDEDRHELAKKLRTQAYEDVKSLYPLADFISKELYNEIKEKRIDLIPIEYQIRKDHSNGKLREIGISSMKQQLLDYIAVDACEVMFMAKIGTYQCASISGRGQIYGKNALEKWINKNPKKCQWIIQCDIKKFYPSVDREILKRYLKRDIANDDILYLIFRLIGTYKEGLCIGSYLSQFLANYILSYAYHYLDEHCFKVRRDKRTNRIYKKLFYMDDILILCSTKTDADKAFKMLTKYLDSEMNLSIKDGWKFYHLGDHPTDMMGFKVSSNRTTVRKRIFDRANKLYHLYKNTSVEMTEEDARRITSYYGYFKHSDSDGYAKKEKIARTLNKAKGVIANADKNNGANA